MEDLWALGVCRYLQAGLPNPQQFVKNGGKIDLGPMSALHIMKPRLA